MAKWHWVVCVLYPSIDHVAVVGIVTWFITYNITYDMVDCQLYGVVWYVVGMVDAVRCTLLHLRFP